MKWSKAMSNYRKILRLYNIGIRPIFVADIALVIVAGIMYSV